MSSRCFTHLFSLPTSATYINSQQPLLQSSGIHFHFRLVINVGQYVWRLQKCRYSRWNFADNSLHCGVKLLPVSDGWTFPFPVSYQPRAVSPIGPLNSATPKTWDLTLEFHKKPNPLPRYYYFRSRGRTFPFLVSYQPRTVSPVCPMSSATPKIWA